MSSRLLITLRTQISLIEKTYINFAYDPLGNYSRTNLLNAAAYLLLAHAELETYIEETVRKVIRLADGEWTKNRKASGPLVAACLFAPKQQGAPREYSTKDELGDFVTKSIKSADTKIGENNGIREHNIIPLLFLSGFQVHSIDPLLIAELDAIGSIRGDHAHKSARHHFAAKFDPFDITKKINAALKLLERFDSDFMKFNRKQFGR